MKRFIISIFTLCVWAFSLHAQNGEFDPANPGDPQPFYVLQVQVSPSAGGTANITRTLVAEGQEIAIRVTPSANFRLEQWVCGEEVLSSDSYLSYTMPARNVTITAQMVYDPSTFDPESPGDPEGQGDNAHRHKVTVYCSPSVGGYTNQSLFYMQEGEQRNLYAYNNAGYAFVGWYVGDRMESQKNPVILTMHESDIVLTARFRFNPASPEDPNVNLFDAALGNLVIDHFTLGRLSDAVYSLVGNENYSNVRSLTVMGEMTTSDYGIVSRFSNLEVLDLSRTTGYTAVPSWAFENMTHLQRVLFPASVETIGENAFYGCSALSEIVLYAPAPPIAEQGAATLFSGVSEGLVIRVPSASLALYQASSLWSSFVILPMDVLALNVELPEDKVALYENMFLELLDTKSGQLFRYVITQRNQYTFTTVFDGTTYQLTLRNAHNKIFGQEMITFAGNDTTVSFTSLKQPIDVSLQVLDTVGNDVTKHAIITWTDSEGKFLTKGAFLNGQVEGDLVFYQIALDESLGVRYQQLDSLTGMVMNPEQRTQAYALRPLQYIEWSGCVIDSISQKPVHNANILFTQNLNGKYINSIECASDAHGHYTARIVDAPTVIAVKAFNYIKREISGMSDNLPDTLYMTPFSGTKLSLSVLYTPAVKAEEEPQTRDWYSDYQNIHLSVYNHTQGRLYENIELNWPQLWLYEKVNDGDSIIITGNSLSNDFAIFQVGAKINNNSCSLVLTIVEKGSISSIYETSASELPVIGLLYDSNGKLYQKSSYSSQTANFVHLPEGNYTLVTMQDSELTNGISKLAKFDNLALQEGVDYVQQSVTVTDGMFSFVAIDTVPALKQQVASYLSSKSSFTVSKSTITVGSYQTFRLKVDFKGEYQSQVSNIKLLVDIPESATFVENTVVGGSHQIPYQINGQQISIPVTNTDDIIRFCVIPTEGGTARTSAYIQFDYNDSTFVQPIGSTLYKVENATLDVRLLHEKRQVAACGITIPNSQVRLYDDGEVVGQAMSDLGGDWNIIADLKNTYNLTSHQIQAEIITSDGTSFRTKSKTLVLDYYGRREPERVEIHHMINMGRGYLEHQIVTWDVQANTITPSSYYYNPSDLTMSFYVYFNGESGHLEDVALIAYSAESNIRVPLAYNEDSLRWEGTYKFTERTLPEQFSVSFMDNSAVSAMDADLLAELYALTDTTGVLAPDSIDFIVQDIYSAIANQDDALADSLLQVLCTEDVFELNNEEIFDVETFLARHDSMVQNDPLYNADFMLDLDALADSIAEWTRGITISDCQGMDTSLLVAQGYERIQKTDGGYIYIQSNASEWRMVDYDANVMYSINLTMDTELAQQIRYIQTNTEAVDFVAAMRQAIAQLEGIRQRMENTVQSIQNAINKVLSFFHMNESAQAAMEIGKTVDNISSGAEVISDGLKLENKYLLNENKQLNIYINNNPNSPASVSLKAIRDDNRRKIASHKRWENKWLKNAKIGKALGKVFKAFDIVSTASSMVDDLNRSINVYYAAENKKQTEKCDEAIRTLTEIQSRNQATGTAAGVYYVAQLTISSVELATMIGGVAAAIPTGGISLSAVAVSATGLIANIAADAIYENRFNNAMNEYNAGIAKVKCKKKKQEKEDEDKEKSPKTKPLIDPSGFVYEAVENNRAENVQATIYYKVSRENIFGEMVEEDVVWDAENYGQENPLYTDKDGVYHWDVPQGLWQVRFEKEGYEPTQSEWLPVPPPQLEVNIPIVQLRQPEVINAIAHKNAIDISFDKYMMPSLLNTDNVFVTANGQNITGTLTLLDEQHSYGEESATYASKIRFVPESEFTAREITLTVSNRVRSYADVPMAQTFQQTFDVQNIGDMERVQTPVPSIASGSQVELGTELSISCATEGAVIRYTLDGTVPDCQHGLIYSMPIMLYGQQSVTIHAIACADGYDPSEMAEWVYTFGKEEALEQTNDQVPQVHKLLQDGHFYILMPDGSKYTILGQEVR